MDEHLIELVADLTEKDRGRAARTLAQHLDAEDVLIAVRDPDVNAWLPAPGWPQTLRDGRGWTAILQRAGDSGRAEGQVAWGHPPILREVHAARLSADAILAVVGGELPPERLHHLRGVLRPLSALLLAERDAANACGRANAAVQAARQAEALARTLSETQDRLEKVMAALERSNRELDQFAYIASHDLRAPLRGIANLAHWIEEDVGPAASTDVQKNLALLRSRVRRMESLIDGILEYSRAGRVRSGAEPVDVGLLLDEVLELLAPPKTVTVEIQRPMPEVVSERVPLQQVFMNLIGNAVKHARRKDARIEIGSRPVGAMVEFAVTDNGPGIAPEYHERIWGIFQTLASRDVVESTGIGLALVKKVVELRGGMVSVQSEASQGSTFRFTWPQRAALEVTP